MKMTAHATVRGQQRGIPVDAVEVILKYGTYERKPGNAFEYKIKKRDAADVVAYLRHQIQLIEKAARKAVLVSSDGTIITTYNVI